MKRVSLVDNLAHEFVYGQTTSNGDEQKIPLTDVHVSPLQYRRYVDPEKLAEITQSIAKHGQLQAVLVRPDPHGRGYELVFGQTRFLACQNAKTETILAKVRDLSDTELLELSLIENYHRSNPNPVEETQGILTLLSLRLGKQESEVIALLNRATTEKKQGSDNVIRTDEWKTIEATLKALGTLTPESFRANRLPILNLPEDILEVLRQGKLEYTKARTIARLKDKKARLALLKETLAKNLSLSEIKTRISEASPNRPQHSASTRSEFDAVYREIKHRKVWNDPKKERKLLKILAQLKDLLDE